MLHPDVQVFGYSLTHENPTLLNCFHLPLLTPIKDRITAQTFDTAQTNCFISGSTEMPSFEKKKYIGKSGNLSITEIVCDYTYTRFKTLPKISHRITES